jgi:hypothetical protein
MKKLIATSLGALVISAGLVASAGTAAQADPYPGTVATSSTAFAADTVKKNQTANVCVKVEVKNGNGTPVGRVTISVTRKAGGFSDSDTFGYAGGKVCFRTGKLHKLGSYSARVRFDARNGSVYKDSSDSTSFDVVKHNS